MGVGGQHHAPADLPSEKTRYPLFRSWVGPRAGLEECGKSRPHWHSIPGPSSPYLGAIPTELPLPTQILCVKFKQYSTLKYEIFPTVALRSKAGHGLLTLEVF
jgi:hypothetical protein